MGFIEANDRKKVRIVEEKNGAGGNLDTTVEIGRDNYQFVCTQSYGPQVTNPTPEQILGYLRGVLPPPHPDSPVTLLLPLQANGRCGGNCKGCVFARNIVGEGYLANATTPEVIKTLLDVAKKRMATHGILPADQRVRVGLLLAGDPSFNPHTRNIVALFGTDPDVIALRLSTIALKNKHPFDAIIGGLENIATQSSSLKVRIQVSLHSTDRSKRINHLKHHGPVSEEIYELPEINDFFGRVKTLTGYNSTLTFVVDANTDIDLAVIDANFDPHTDIALRPIISTTRYTADPMLPSKFLELYQYLRSTKRVVRIIPSSEKGMEQENLLTSDFPVVPKLS